MRKINNDIKESYCSFEVSKLLKEKGFKVPCMGQYSVKGELVLYFQQESFRGFNLESEVSQEWPQNHEWEYDGYKNLCFAPTHALAIEWIRVNFDILIEISKWRDQPVGKELWKHAFQFFANGETDGIAFKTPQEVNEAALLHVLNNMLNK